MLRFFEAMGRAGARRELEDIRLEARIEKTAPMRADPDRLLQVVSNLLTNAVKFTPRGGEVRVTLECAGEQARLVVSDSGRDPVELVTVLARLAKGQGRRVTARGVVFLRP